MGMAGAPIDSLQGGPIAWTHDLEKAAAREMPSNEQKNEHVRTTLPENERTVGYQYKVYRSLHVTDSVVGVFCTYTKIGEHSRRRDPTNTPITTVACRRVFLPKVRAGSGPLACTAILTHNLRAAHGYMLL